MHNLGQTRSQDENGFHLYEIGMQPRCRSIRIVHMSFVAKSTDIRT